MLRFMDSGISNPRDTRVPVNHMFGIFYKDIENMSSSKYENLSSYFQYGGIDWDWFDYQLGWDGNPGLPRSHNGEFARMPVRTHPRTVHLVKTERKIEDDVKILIRMDDETYDYIKSRFPKDNVADKLEELIKKGSGGTSEKNNWISLKEQALAVVKRSFVKSK